MQSFLPIILRAMERVEHFVLRFGSWRLSMILLALAAGAAGVLAPLLFRAFGIEAENVAGMAALTGAIVAFPFFALFARLLGSFAASRRRLREAVDRVARKNRALAEAEEALRRANHRLETRVRERTAALENALVSARQANDAKTMFLANMSHELRTPLNGIIGYAEMIQNRRTLFESIDDETLDSYADSIAQSGRLLCAIVGDLLDLSRIESGAIELTPEPQCPRRAIGDIVRAILPTAERRGQHVTMDVAPGGPRLHADRLALHQIVTNLLSNALKYSPDGAEIVIAVRFEKGTAHVTVTDPGIGMSEADIAEATEPFSRFSDAHIASGESIGLGLSIVSKLCLLHGGTLGFDSAPGQGTAVTVTFPAPVPVESALRA